MTKPASFRQFGKNILKERKYIKMKTTTLFDGVRNTRKSLFCPS